MEVSAAHVFPGFQYQHNFSFQNHQLLFSHASAEVRGENTPERIRLNRELIQQPPGHESVTLTTEPTRRDSTFESH